MYIFVWFQSYYDVGTLFKTDSPLLSKQYCSNAYLLICSSMVYQLINYIVIKDARCHHCKQVT